MLTEKLKQFDIPVVDTLTFTGDANALIEHTRPLSGIEGFVVEFESGYRVKIKADEYVRIHKVKDKIRTDRHILALLLENELDDVYPHLDENDYERVKLYEGRFHVALNRKVREIEQAARDAWLAANFNKKALATQVLPNSGIDKNDWPLVFKFADGNDDFGALVMDRVRSKLSNTVKYNELAKWLGLDEDKTDDQ